MCVPSGAGSRVDAPACPIALAARPWPTAAALLPALSLVAPP